MGIECRVMISDMIVKAGQRPIEQLNLPGTDFTSTVICPFTHFKILYNLGMDRHYDAVVLLCKFVDFCCTI